MVPGTVDVEGSMVLSEDPVRRIADIGLAAFKGTAFLKLGERQRHPANNAVRAGCAVRCSTVPGRVTGGRRGWRAVARRRRPLARPRPGRRARLRAG